MSHKDYVIANGCFDVFHAGHLMFLQYCAEVAKKNNCKFVLGLDSDDKIVHDKGGGRPILSLKERMDVISSFGLVDSFFYFDSNESLDMKIKSFQPRFLIKGQGWSHYVVGKEHAKEVIFYDKEFPISTSKIVEKIKERVL